MTLGDAGVVTSESLRRALPDAAFPASDDLSSPQRVAYQGVPGAYSEGAALKSCAGWEPLPCEQFEVAFQALSQWMAERAVLPIENSLGGSIHTVYDLLLRYHNLNIVGETSIRVNHCLLALPGTRIEDVERVMSHPQALAQCDLYLKKMGVIKEAVDDTAGAAQAIAKGQMKNVAAVASARAAELYGLEILDKGIQDNSDNVTRFIVLSRDPMVYMGPTEIAAGAPPFKTSIVFSLKEGPGQLFKALSVFALRDIDLTKIESRPMRTNPIVGTRPEDSVDGDLTVGRRLNYIFYVDFVGTMGDQKIQNALRNLQELSTFVRVLGSYPMDVSL